MVTSDFRSEVEIWPFCTCTIKNMQYNPYQWPNRRNVHFLKEIGVEEHDADVRLKSGSGNTGFSCMHNAFGHNYRNSLIILDLAIGQITRSTERISSYYYYINYGAKHRTLLIYSHNRNQHHNDT